MRNILLEFHRIRPYFTSFVRRTVDRARCILCDKMYELLSLIDDFLHTVLIIIICQQFILCLFPCDHT